MAMELPRTLIALVVAGGALSGACGGTSHAPGNDDMPGKDEPEASAPRNPESDAGVQHESRDKDPPQPSRDSGHPKPSREARPEPRVDAASVTTDAAPPPSMDAGDAGTGVVCHGAGARFAT